jgi:flavin reductase (DIM6/NTAB) family NADH-FMN oxidoreductase RutF
MLTPIRRQANDSDFLSAMSQAVTGVNVVTTDGPAGRYGLTVSAVSSVSAEPPMVLVCVNQKNVACDAIEGNGSFAINVLDADQQAVAETFSGSDAHGGPYTFNPGDWEPAVTGSPVLKRAVATFDCRIVECVPAGTHKIFIGLVLAAQERPGTPLLYTSRDYGRPAPRPGTENVLEPICA